MSKKNPNKPKKPNTQQHKPKQPPQSGAWAAVKDLITNPFEYSHKPSMGWGKLLGGVCLLMALCLLFYITGHM